MLEIVESGQIVIDPEGGFLLGDDPAMAAGLVAFAIMFPACVAPDLTSPYPDSR